MGVKWRELPGFVKVNKVTSASLGYPPSVFNKTSTLKTNSRVLGIPTISDQEKLYSQNFLSTVVTCTQWGDILLCTFRQYSGGAPLRWGATFLGS